jgi:hypothetical protein
MRFAIWFRLSPDLSDCGIVFTKFGIVNVIDKTIQNLAAQESGFAFHAKGFYLLFQYVLLIVT